MPVYEFHCRKHGRFEAYRTMADCTRDEPCPRCSAHAERLISCPTIKIVQGAKRLPLGSGSEGKVVLGKETGGLDIFVPSYGALEQAEVDYIAEGAVEKERARVKKAKKRPQRVTQERIQGYAALAMRAKPGQRAKTIRQAIKETGDRLVKTT